METFDLGLIGLAVMGENLALNLDRNGFSVASYNRTPERTDAFLTGRARNTRIRGFHRLEDLVAGLGRPRKVMLMVRAGRAVDDTIEHLLGLLDPGDILIDGGNSHYEDTARRVLDAESKGLLYIGTGVSGGEQGALEGPSIMPGGSPKAWPHVKKILQTIAARAADGEPCCDWVGPGGAGHFVKMVHNGIEYADMQLICEAYALMDRALGLRPEEMSGIFRDWNRGDLESYLTRITADILSTKDPETGEPLVQCILDTAGHKGTGLWTARAALELGVPAQTITEALFARCQSARKDERLRASSLLESPPEVPVEDREPFLRELHDALLAARICSYAQGFQLIREASLHYRWALDLGRISLLWREGCIIRARLLEPIREAYRREPDLPNLLLDPAFRDRLRDIQPGWRSTVTQAVKRGIPVPALSSALNYYDTCRAARLPANLLQAQRDYFGAHTYERVDRPRGEFFHTEWKEG